MTFRPALPLVLLMFVNGCAALPIAAVGSALGLATSAAGAGGELYGSGKLDSAELASFAQADAAVVAAADELGLDVTDGRFAKFKYVLRLEDGRRTKVLVTLEPRTPRLTRVRIDVGLFGSEPTARLLLQRMRAHLGVPAAELK